MHVALGIGIGLGVVTAAGALQSVVTAQNVKQQQQQQQQLEKHRPSAPTLPPHSSPPNPVIDFLLSHNRKQVRVQQWCTTSCRHQDLPQNCNATSKPLTHYRDFYRAAG